MVLDVRVSCIDLNVMVEYRYGSPKNARLTHWVMATWILVNIDLGYDLLSDDKP